MLTRAELKFEMARRIAYDVDGLALAAFDRIDFQEVYLVAAENALHAVEQAIKEKGYRPL